MEEDKNYVEHEGIVIDAGTNHVNIQVIVKSACAGCHIKGSCSLSEIQEKVIEVNHNKEGLVVGEHVQIGMESALGYKALLLGYLIPFSIVLVTLIICLKIFNNEGTAAGIALGLTAIYYLIIYFFRTHLQKAFRYTVKRIQ